MRPFIRSKELDDALLDVYSNAAPSIPATALSQALGELKPYARSEEALRLLETDATKLSVAARIGQTRARLEHVAGLKMLRSQTTGDTQQALAWRTLITLPQFAEAVAAVVFVHWLATLHLASLRRGLASFVIN